MPKPQSKKELLELSQKNYKALIDLVNSYSTAEAKKEFPPGTLNRNLRDILSHLHHWHLLMLDWYKVGMKGEKPIMPAEGYTWKTLPDLNKKIWKDTQDLDLKSAKKILDKSFKKVQAIISNHSDIELFEKKRYKWTGSTSLGAYLIQNSSSHYNWAIKIIKKGMR